MNVLCVTDYFLPGFRGGGPIRTVANMRKLLAGRIALSVFTRDRDLGSICAYEDVEPNRWIETPEGQVWYASPKAFGPRGLKMALAERSADIVYLNSFFSLRSSIRTYFALRRSMPHIPVLLAPRGEFSPGALAIKQLKKQRFLRLARGLGLYQDIFWHASTSLEARDILQHFPKAEGNVFVACDPVAAGPVEVSAPTVPKQVGRLRIVFISRLSPMKNLDGLLDVLATVRSDVDLDIFGPAEDESYWQRCETIISTLPRHVQVKSHGPIAPNDVSATFARYDLFAFPTRGENFGHVIFEALRAGTPVLLSDQTPWREDEGGAVTVVPLSDRTGWRNAVERAASCAPEAHQRLRELAAEYAQRYAAQDGSLQEIIEMFCSVVSRSPGSQTSNSFEVAQG